MSTASQSHESAEPVNSATDNVQPLGNTGTTTQLRTVSQPSSGQSTASKDTSSGKLRSRAVCRFYATSKGCRAGDSCRYQHVGNSVASVADQAPRVSSHNANSTDPIVPRQQPQVSRQQQIITKPVSASQKADPRAFEISQVIKRFSPIRKDDTDATTLSFALKPSDPDFPFELKGGLRCRLTVPLSYPQNGRPRLQIENEAMPKGFQINVQKGFDELVLHPPRKSLLGLLNGLDRKLEQLLTSEKAQTVKIVANIPKRAPDAEVMSKQTQPTTEERIEPTFAMPMYTKSQRSDAHVKRQADVRQLEARMGKMPMYSKSADGTMYGIPIQVPKVSELPPCLQYVKDIVLFVPELYNLEPCTVHLKGVEDQEAQNVEIAFAEHCKQDTSATLMSHINHLTQNMKGMAVSRPVHPEVAVPEAEPDSFLAPTEAEQHQAVENVADPERPHLRIIPRPPEWDNVDNDSGSSSGYTDSDEQYTDSEEDTEERGGASLPAQANLTTSDRGVSVSFPDIELYGIELLEIASLALSIKCDRCKTVADIKNLRPATAENTITVSQSCSKCAYSMTASYRAEPVHAHNIRVGYLDLVDCTVQDMLPSVFLPTCSECSTRVSNSPGVVSVRGDTTLSICRECHQKMTFKIPNIKFLRTSSQHQQTNLARRKPKRENLGITTGTPLPDNGRCSHYRKSYRWFRFMCCNKVYSCDRCHDEKAEPKHANEHANRMICGWCSREQNYRPDDCGFCGRNMVAKKGGGFWEGGKGTRNQMQMSRKEPRKYKRIGGTNKAKENR